MVLCVVLHHKDPPVLFIELWFAARRTTEGGCHRTELTIGATPTPAMATPQVGCNFTSIIIPIHNVTYAYYYTVHISDVMSSSCARL